MNQRLFFGVLSAIVIGWFAAIGYASSKQLDSPIFFDHYIDEYIQDQIHLQFYYITNKGDEDTINFISMGEITGYVDQYYDPYLEEIPYEQRYAHHEVRSVHVKLDLSVLEDRDKKLVFDKMTVHLSDGRSELVDIGEIIFHPGHYPAKNYLSQNLSASGENWSGFILDAEESFSVKSIQPHIPDSNSVNLKVRILKPENHVYQSNYTEVLEENVEKKQGINYEELGYPIVLQEENQLAVTFLNEGRLKYVLRSWIMIEGKDKDGAEISFPALLSEVPWFTEKDVKYIIEQKGAAN